MKYSRISRAESIPRSASNSFHFFTSSIAASVIGNNRFFFSCSSRLPRVGNFRLHPVTAHAVLRQDQQQLVMQPNRVIDLLMDLPPALNIVRRKPAANALGLQIGIEPVSEFLVFGRVADKAGVDSMGRPTIDPM